VLKRPILTEKTTFGIENMHVYVFEVASDANRTQVRQAVETLFEVKVRKVNIRNRLGKRKRLGRSHGFGKDTKHAIVTLRKGDKIDVY
jgi:large subunit ribosomal protein L23